MRIWDVRAPKGGRTEKTKGSNINIGWNPEGTLIGVGRGERKVR